MIRHIGRVRYNKLKYKERAVVAPSSAERKSKDHSLGV